MHNSGKFINIEFTKDKPHETKELARNLSDLLK